MFRFLLLVDKIKILLSLRGKPLFSNRWRGGMDSKMRFDFLRIHDFLREIFIFIENFTLKLLKIIKIRSNMFFFGFSFFEHLTMSVGVEISTSSEHCHYPSQLARKALILKPFVLFFILFLFYFKMKFYYYLCGYALIG